MYAPSGDYVAYVKNVHGKPEIYIYTVSPTAVLTKVLTPGTQPDWQPVPTPSLGS